MSGPNMGWTEVTFDARDGERAQSRAQRALERADVEHDARRSARGEREQDLVGVSRSGAATTMRSWSIAPSLPVGHAGEARHRAGGVGDLARRSPGRGGSATSSGPSCRRRRSPERARPTPLPVAGRPAPAPGSSATNGSAAASAARRDSAMRAAPLRSPRARSTTCALLLEVAGRQPGADAWPRRSPPRAPADGPPGRGVRGRSRQAGGAGRRGPWRPTVVKSRRARNARARPAARGSVPRDRAAAPTASGARGCSARRRP